MLKLGPVRLELFPTDSAKTVNQKGGEQAIGFKHLAFEVAKLEPAIEALRGVRHRASDDLALHVLEVMEAIVNGGPTGESVAILSPCDRPRPLKPISLLGELN